MAINSRFQLLYKRKAHLHHYAQVDNMDMGLFAESLSSINELVHEYKDLEKQQHICESSSVDLIERIKVLS